jgi:hypothetical protein
MSFGEFIFSTGFTQKTTKEDLNIKRYHGIILWCIHRKVLEDTRGLHTEAGLKSLPGGAGQLHPCATRPPVVGRHHELLEYSSTTSKVASQPYVKSSLIQGLIFNLLGYKSRVEPP